MDAKAIPTLPMGEIDYDALASEIAKNKDRPVIINVNIGTTVKGAVDNLDRILRILKTLDIPRERYHIHCDGALFAMMMPFVDWAPEVSFRKPIDSIAVSGHKMLGCPMPCGIALTRKEHVKKVEQRIDYLNSVDTTIMGSRNGQAALYLWYSLRKKGIAGIKRDVVWVKKNDCLFCCCFECSVRGGWCSMFAIGNFTSHVYSHSYTDSSSICHFLFQLTVTAWKPHNTFVTRLPKLVLLVVSMISRQLLSSNVQRMISSSNVGNWHARKILLTLWSCQM